MSFEINKGNFVGLLGSSGSGKTVVLNTITGAIKRFDGNVWVEGLNRHKWNSFHANAKIGVYQQMDFSLETLSCENYLKNYCTYSGIKKEFQNEAIKFWLQFFELWEHKDKNVRDFSWGMKNRVNLILCFLKIQKLWFLMNQEQT
ncbi:ATP-binding cassette domain-containing protein [Spiroplasma clarkii]|uniref:ATP-binding cassette domain-containing protein n=1 Tax=Spiroplasma clarkii TaxID=2139 RepID=UPI00214FB0AE|nr:ATP-binding cassette domain-containing protein [Spiroplasma clarkii]